MKITNRPATAVPPTGPKQAATAPTETAPVTPPSVTAQFSEEAREKVLTSSGKNAASPAHRARAVISGYEGLAKTRFGRIVSALAKGEEVSMPTESAEASVGPTPLSPPAPAPENAPAPAPPLDAAPHMPEEPAI